MDLKRAALVSIVFMHPKCGTAPQQGHGFLQTRTTPTVFDTLEKVFAFH